MQISEVLARVKKIKQAYNVANRLEGYKTWGVNEYFQGLEGDVGDLAKLMLARRGFVFGARDTEKKIGRELADILWSVLVLADEMDTDIEKEFLLTLTRLEEKVKERAVVKKKSKSV